MRSKRLERIGQCSLLAVAVLVVVLLVVAGCGTTPTEVPPTPVAEGPTPEATATTPPEPTPAAAPKQLVVAMAQLAPHADHEFSYCWETTELVHNLEDRLYWFETQQNPAGYDEMIYGTKGLKPELFESCEVDAEQTTWTCHVLKGVKSYYGNEMTAQDVKYEIDRWFGCASMGGFIAGVINLPSDGYRVIDDYTMEFKLTKPSPLFLHGMATWAGGVLDSTEVQKHATSEDPWAKDWVALNSAGFGAYHIESLVKGQEMILVANPNYWQFDPPIEKIIMREIPESANRMALLVAGDVDIAEHLSPRELDQLQETKPPGVKIIQVDGNLFVHQIFNVTREPFGDPKVRQAIAYAAPYEEILSAVFKGRAGRPISWGLVPRNDGVVDVYKYDTDLDKAKSLLAEAGYADGLEMGITYDAGRPEHEEIAVLIQSNLRKIGIDVNLEKLPKAVFDEKWASSDFDTAIQTDYALMGDAGYALYLYFHPASPINSGKYNNEEYVEKLEEANSILDEDQRRQIFAELQEILAEDVPSVMLAYPLTYYSLRDDVTGVTWFLDNQYHFKYMDKK